MFYAGRPMEYGGWQIIDVASRMAMPAQVSVISA
jgi:hypothetical protein